MSIGDSERRPPLTDDGCSAPEAHLTRDELAIITWVDERMGDVLGWQPGDMVGQPSTLFIHTEDQATAVAAWFEMRENPGKTVQWRGRYRTAAGDWQWVETENTNCLDDPVHPVVHTVMRRFTPTAAGVAEELRARKQLLNRLADAVPVGLFQLERNMEKHVEITFTNDRFLDMFGPEAAATARAQFARVLPEDVSVLENALARVLGDEPVDHVEFRYLPPDDRRRNSPRVCHLSLRPLTDDTGAVSGAIGCVSDVTESVELRRELELRAAVDGLTGCLNRQSTMDLLDATVRNLHEAGSTVAVIFIDIDRFKDVNDVHGHAAGDRVLVEAADRIRQVIRSNDRFGRIGGDEFLVICPDVASTQMAMNVAERVARALHGAVEIPGGVIEFQSSVGVAWAAGPTTSDALVATADTAMYRSKREGLGSAVMAG